MNRSNKLYTNVKSAKKKRKEFSNNHLNVEKELEITKNILYV